MTNESEQSAALQYDALAAQAAELQAKMAELAIDAAHEKALVDNARVTELDAQISLLQAERLSIVGIPTPPPAKKRGRKANGRVMSVGESATVAYDGRTYTLSRKPDGFFCNGVRYDSMTAAAVAITGHSTNGPKFWGYRD